jgi:hypothetical protein
MGQRPGSRVVVDAQGPPAAGQTAPVERSSAWPLGLPRRSSRLLVPWDGQHSDCRAAGLRPRPVLADQFAVLDDVEDVNVVRGSRAAHRRWRIRCWPTRPGGRRSGLTLVDAVAGAERRQVEGPLVAAAGRPLFERRLQVQPGIVRRPPVDRGQMPITASSRPRIDAKPACFTSWRAGHRAASRSNL